MGERDLEVAEQLGSLNANVAELMRSYVRLETATVKGFNDLGETLDRHAKSEEKQRRELEARVRSLERFRTWCLGAWAGVAALLAAAKALFAWRG